MSIHTLNPTLFQSPDAILGGNSVDSPSTTGHTLSGVSAGAFGPGFDSESCRWHTFQNAPSGIITKITLKITHSSSGGLTGAGASNGFTLSYSLNGGGSWIDAVQRSNFTSSLNDTFSVDLSANQDVSQVQVRDIAFGSVGDIENEAASVAFTISDIKLEVTTQNQQSGIAFW